jgi:hypothetical protein
MFTIRQATHWNTSNNIKRQRNWVPVCQNTFRLPWITTAILVGERVHQNASEFAWQNKYLQTSITALSNHLGGATTLIIAESWVNSVKVFSNGEKFDRTNVSLKNRRISISKHLQIVLAEEDESEESLSDLSGTLWFIPVAQWHSMSSRRYLTQSRFWLESEPRVKGSHVWHSILAWHAGEWLNWHDILKLAWDFESNEHEKYESWRESRLRLPTLAWRHLSSTRSNSHRAGSNSMRVYFLWAVFAYIFMSRSFET